MLEGFAVAPGVLAILHGGGFVSQFAFVVDGLLVEVGVSFGESDPFGFALEEAEVATGPGPPGVVAG